MPDGLGDQAAVIRKHMELSIGEKWNGWTVEEVLGQGSFGKVYHIVKEEYGNRFESALKVISIPQNESELESVRSQRLDEDSARSYYMSLVSDISNECALMYRLRGNSSIVTGLASTISPTAQGTAMISVMRIALTLLFLVSLIFPRANDVDILGRIAAATAVAIEIGMLVITTALLENRPYRVVVMTSSHCRLPIITFMKIVWFTEVVRFRIKLLSIKGVMTRIVSFIRGPNGASLCSVSPFMRSMNMPRCLKYTYVIKISATSTPLPVPNALPIAPRIASGVAPAQATDLIRRNAAPMLTTALAICSKICETDVCSIDWFA